MSNMLVACLMTYSIKIQVTALSTGQGDKLDYWIGGEDRDNDGVWTWATSGNPITYSNWWSNQGILKVNMFCDKFPE